MSTTAQSPLLDGRVVVVTGGGRGVGRAQALACARAGARIFVNDLGCDREGKGSDPRVAAAVAEEIRALGAEAASDDTDLGSDAGPQRIIRSAIDTFGRVDGVISAAGIAFSRTVLKMDDDALARMIDIQLRGSFGLIRASARAMIDGATGGSIVLHSAPVAFFGAMRQSGLAAVTAAIVGLARCSALELRKHGIRVNVIAPTARTRSTEDLPLFQSIGPGSMQPEQVAPTALFLLSDLAKDINGEVVGVAGARIYAVRSHETPGVFDPEPLDTAEPEVAARRVAELWKAATSD